MKEETMEHLILAIFRKHIESQGQKIDASYIATLTKGKSKKLQAICLKKEEIQSGAEESETKVESALRNLESRGILAHTESGESFWFVTPLGILFLGNQSRIGSLESLLSDLAGAVLEIAKERIEVALSIGSGVLKRPHLQFLVILMLLWGARSAERALLWQADKTIRIYREPLEYFLERLSNYIPIFKRSIMDKVEGHVRRGGAELEKVFHGLFYYEKKKGRTTKSWFDISGTNSDDRLRTVCEILLNRLPSDQWNSLVLLFENCAYGNEMSRDHGRLLELSGLFGGSYWETEWACKVHTTLRTLLVETSDE